MTSGNKYSGGKRLPEFFRYLCLFALFGSLASPAFGAEILFVTSTNTPPSSDQVLIDRLTSNGHNVTTVEDSSSLPGDDLGKDLIVISATVRSSDVNTKFKLSLVPVVTWEAFLYDDMGMTGPVANVDYGGDFNQQSIEVTGTHTLTAFLQGTVAASIVNNRFRWGIPNSNAIVSAHIVGNPAKPAIFHYETGAVMVDGIAPARRIAWFFDNGTPTNWNNNARQLFDTMIEFALSPDTNQAPAATADAPSSAEIDATVQLDGAFTDDGLATPVSTQWFVDDSPGGANVSFDDASDPQTTATFDTAGTYDLRFRASDPQFNTDALVSIEISEDPVPGGGDVLFVARLPANQADQIIIARLQSQGLSVESIDDDQVETSDGNGKDLIVISSTILSSKINTKFTNSAIPVLVWESALYDDLQMSNSRGTQGGQQSIAVTGGAPLAAGLSGNVQIATTNQSVRWGIPSAGAEVTATVVGNSSRATIFSYESGASMFGMSAPARRV
ncbi:MAG: hypothetical protein AAF993_14065, partial [Pseudomonadota bacterium]